MNFIFKWKLWVVTGCLFCFQGLAQHEYNSRKQRSCLFLHNKTFMEGKVSSLKFGGSFNGFLCVISPLQYWILLCSSCIDGWKLNYRLLLLSQWTESSLESVLCFSLPLPMFPHSVALEWTTWLTQLPSLLKLLYKALILKWKCCFLEQVLGGVVCYV